MPDNNETIIMDDLLLLSYVSGNMNDDDMKEVEKWMKLSEENARLVEQLYFVYQTSGKLGYMNSIDTGKALLKFKHVVRERGKKRYVQNIFQYVQKAAAILLLPLLGYILYFSLNSAEDMTYVEVRNTPGMVSEVHLPDGSLVWLNSDSYLRYPSCFQGQERKIEFTGQAYFKVKKKRNKPFIVGVGKDYQVKVLGTEFNINAFPDDGTIETTLVNGRVEINAVAPNGTVVKRVMIPDYKSVYIKDNGNICVTHVNTFYETAWKEGKIVFRSNSMSQVLKTLSRNYNVDFRIKDPVILESSISATFTHEPLSRILEYLNIASDIKFETLTPLQSDDGTINKPVVEVSKN